jgi:phosphatidylinositol glycan class O
MFGEYFDEEIHYPSHNVRDLDTNDKNVHKDILNYLKIDDPDQSRKFDLLVCHLLGIDHAGHTFGAEHPEIERKILETDQILKDIF